MTGVILELGDRHDERAYRTILDRLTAFNRDRAADPDYRPLNVLLRDGSGEVGGGLRGHTAWDWFVVELLFVPLALRGQGVGRRVMATAEAEAIRRDCANAWLDTHEFQARGFYERLGYECFGELPDYPVGHARYFLRKSLVREHATRGG